MPISTVCALPKIPSTSLTYDPRRSELGKLCLKFGRRTEAAYWFLTSGGSVEALGELFLEEPRMAALLPARLIEVWEEVRRTNFAVKDKRKLLDLLKGAWKKYRVDDLLAKPTCSLSNGAESWWISRHSIRRNRP